MYNWSAIDKPYSIRAIGKDFGLTDERIRQIIKHALAKLKKYPHNTELLEHYEDWQERPVESAPGCRRVRPRPSLEQLESRGVRWRRYVP